jgi:glucose-1-phosphate cytidylyltransferase
MAPIRDVVVLCGGRGTRLRSAAESLPKPLVEIGGRPILEHVVRLYAAAGFERAWLCTGYLGEQVRAFAEGCDWPAGIDVRCLDTGEDTPTGGRVLQAARALGARAFCATYADGVSDVDLRALVAHHQEHGALATVTVVRPELPFGVARLDRDGRVTGFAEKPRTEHWVNGGFLCFEPGVVAHLAQDSVLEREPLEALAAAGELRAFRHEGFWGCMDTFKDFQSLNELWASGEAPWAPQLALEDVR